MKKITRLLPVVFIILFHSCIKEEIPVPETGPEAAITIAAGTSASRSTRGFGDTDPADNTLEQLRILIFNGGGGSLVENIHIPDINVKNPYTIEIPTGTYDFVFIGNEDSDSGLTLLLDAFTTSNTISDLETLSFDAAAFDSSKKIPMAYTERGIQIIDDNTYKRVDDTANQTGTWEVLLKRLAMRLDVKITTENSVKAADFKKLVISNIPTHVPVLETDASGNTLYNGGASGSSSLTITKANGDTGSFDQNARGVYEWVASRLILPSTVFTSDAESDALTLECHYVQGETSVSPLKTGIDDYYQVPRNTFITATMAITPSLTVYVGVEDWDEKILEVFAGRNRELNVSEFSISITTNTRARIWFSSNMPEVTVSLQSGGSLDDYFKDLPDHNLHYDYDATTGMGSGYIDFMTCDGYDKGNIGGLMGGLPVNITAGGLTRTVSVSITDTGTNSSDKIGYFEYVGAFWRNDQVGERVITGRSTGTWTAEIVSGREWAVLGVGKSMDKGIYENPDDAENYPVDGDSYIVSGTGEVNFRIGAKSQNSGAPRYGRVRIITTSNSGSTTAYIYLRQGEEADYLMRPQDVGKNNYGTESSWGENEPRPLANKILPYNVTAANITGGSNLSNQTKIGKQQGVLVEYPTQAGAFFFWGESASTVYAIHPVNGTGSFGSSWSNTISNVYWDSLDQDVCPPGYRRPNNGTTGSTGKYDSAEYSEMMQTLWLNPEGVVSSSNTYNCYFGYYAAGFFDRRRIEDPVYGQSDGINTASAVDKSGSTVAYTGCLLFNPDEDFNASVFFPCPGIRLSSSNGILRYTGKQAYYWTSTAPSNAAGFAMHIISPETSSNGEFISRGGMNMKMTSPNRANGAFIRCVAE